MVDRERRWGFEGVDMLSLNNAEVCACFKTYKGTGIMPSRTHLNRAIICNRGSKMFRANNQ